MSPPTIWRKFTPMSDALPNNYATPNVGHLPTVKCPPSPAPNQTPPPGHIGPWLRPTLNSQYCMHIRIWQRATEIVITVRYGYAALITSTDVFLNCC